MWFSFWRSRDRFSIDHLRYLADQLQKVQVVNEVNKGFVIEALRAIAELVTYGDQHDSAFFEFFMEKQIMDEFIRLLKISTVTSVAIQILQTMSIMIQNLRNEHATYYMFSNEHINSLIVYPFDFQNEELLSYYISFLRAISGKLDKSTISLFVKTQNEDVISFPLYVEAVRFAFHEENMVRIAVRALTLNIYHVGDAHVNKYITSRPLSEYFADLITHFQKKCKVLDDYVYETSKKPDPVDSALSIVTAVDEIEDSLYYFSDVISAGVSELVHLITDNILQLLVFPLLLPSLTEQHFDSKIGVSTSLYLLSCILHTVKTKDLAGSIAAALFCSPECFIKISEAKLNGWVPNQCLNYVHQPQHADSISIPQETEGFEDTQLTSFSPSAKPKCCQSQLSLRVLLLSYIKGGTDVQGLGSLNLLSTLLQTKELDESMLDGFGILPQRQQHKKLLLQTLVGEGSGEEQLFSCGSSSPRDCGNTELDNFLQKIKDHYGAFVCCEKREISPQIHRSQVLDALVSLFCRSAASSEVLWAGGWLFKQLLPQSETDFCNYHLHDLKVSHECSRNALFEEAKGRWCDMLMTILLREWINCRKAIESTLQKDVKHILFPLRKYYIEGDSSSAAGERMCEIIKVFVLKHLLLMLISKGTLVDPPAVYSSSFTSVNNGATTTGSDLSLKPGMEISLGDAVPCRIAFERGKECHFSFLAVTKGTSGWVLLADESAQKPHYGVVRVVAPLAGSNPRVDEKHRKWLHLRIRPSSLPSIDISKSTTFGKGKTKALVDGRWTLAFHNEETCLSAESIVVAQMSEQSTTVQNRLQALLDSNN